MKMKYIVLGYTVVVALLLCFVYFEMTKENDFEVDMVYYNRQLKEIVSELQQARINDEQITAIESTHNCTILFLTEEDYQKQLNGFISEGAVIFDYISDGKLEGKIIWEMSKNRYEEMSQERSEIMLLLLGIMILAGFILLAAIYYIFIRPFRVLERFSTEIAKGNLDFKLPMEKRNMFGAFTESFDIMREELKNAREREYQANISKKELVAELSHDIKTPVSTIKATCEVMQVKESNQATRDKINVILNKADMIDQLVGNMFHATMEELQALKVEVIEESSLSIPEMFNDLKYYGNLIMRNQIPECLVYMDKLRMKQVIDNIVNNSYKYAGTDIHVSFEQEHFMEEDLASETEEQLHQKSTEGIRITIRDYGKGVPDDELALITEKFYRGSNAKGKSGSGIGLYLSKSFMRQMGGEMYYYNDEGFVVELFLRKV